MYIRIMRAPFFTFKYIALSIIGILIFLINVIIDEYLQCGVGVIEYEYWFFGIKAAYRERKKVAIFVVEEFSSYHISVPWFAFPDAQKNGNLFETFLFSDTKGIVQSENILLINALYNIDDALSADIIGNPYRHDRNLKPSDRIISSFSASQRARETDCRFKFWNLFSWLRWFTGRLWVWRSQKLSRMRFVLMMVILLRQQE